EACANSLEHAGGFDPGAVATVTGTATAEEVELQITDYGGWKPAAAGSGDRGRGLLLMRRMMDEITISADGSGTTVRLRKGL
ncbi:MAG TPA: ATP-binding protein, partial [Pseudonocardiaceae bacterium]|nr:ATP-binding protein [Pseudonocardiaceae bacterium]